MSVSTVVAVHSTIKGREPVLVRRHLLGTVDQGVRPRHGGGSGVAEAITGCCMWIPSCTSVTISAVVALLEVVVTLMVALSQKKIPAQ